MENIAVAIITSIATLLVALIGLFGSKKLGYNKRPLSLGDQSKLISTLKDTLAAQTERIKLLEAAHVEQIAILAAKEEEIIDLKRRVSNLEQLTIEQAFTIRQLQTRRRHLPVKHEGGEANTDEDIRI